MSQSTHAPGSSPKAAIGLYVPEYGVLHGASFAAALPPVSQTLPGCVRVVFFFFSYLYKNSIDSVTLCVSAGVSFSERDFVLLLEASLLDI